jgi:hypothetical protein
LHDPVSGRREIDVSYYPLTPQRRVVTHIGLFPGASLDDEQAVDDAVEAHGAKMAIALESPSGKILPITESELRGNLLPGYRIVRVCVTEADVMRVQCNPVPEMPK